MAIDRALSEIDVELEEIAPRMATREELARVHTAEYLDLLEGTRGLSRRLDPDTSTSPGSVDAAYLAAGTTIDLFSRVAKKESPPGIALVRPPGHHALPGWSMGFCLINSVAVAARALVASGLAERIAIYDWDVHHGNGTQDIFYDDARILYLSTHQWPFYPGTGAKTEIGSGKAAGATLNIPLPEGTRDEEFIRASEEILFPKVRNFSPDLILISAGFDPYEQDPIGGLKISIEGFRRLAGRWRELAEKSTGGRIAAVLEGGYHLEGLGSAVAALIEEWST